MSHFLTIALTVLLACVLLQSSWGDQDPEKPEEPPTLERHELAALLKERARRGGAYLPFLKRDTLHCGIYHLAKGVQDGQSPHAEDEVYYVLSGVAQFTAGEKTVPVGEGDVLFVAAHEEHRFHDIEEDLDLLVFFSSAKGKKGE